MPQPNSPQFNSPQQGSPLSPLDFRIGLGDDTHRLGPGGPLRLGGIDIDGEYHAIGHSDADVLLHAIVDALLGAAHLGDIGRLFPDTHEENRGRDSAEFLQAAIEKVTAAGWQVVNIDCVVLAERPKISSVADTICDRIASILGIPADRISVKGKTGEGVGPIGRREAISARVVALLARNPPEIR